MRFLPSGSSHSYGPRDLGKKAPRAGARVGAAPAAGGQRSAGRPGARLDWGGAGRSRKARWRLGPGLGEDGGRLSRRRELTIDALRHKTAAAWQPPRCRKRSGSEGLNTAGLERQDEHASQGQSAESAPWVCPRLPCCKGLPCS